jgi:hypothetical protein
MREPSADVYERRPEGEELYPLLACEPDEPELVCTGLSGARLAVGECRPALLATVKRRRASSRVSNCITLALTAGRMPLSCELDAVEMCDSSLMGGGGAWVCVGRNLSGMMRDVRGEGPGGTGRGVVYTGWLTVGGDSIISSELSVSDERLSCGMSSPSLWAVWKLSAPPVSTRRSTLGGRKSSSERSSCVRPAVAAKRAA